MLIAILKIKLSESDNILPVENAKCGQQDHTKNIKKYCGEMHGCAMSKNSIVWDKVVLS